MDKISKVNRVNPADLNLQEAWLRRRQDDESSGNKQQFQNMLKQTIKKQKDNDQNIEETEAAVWEGNSATQSLFYQQGVDLRFFHPQSK